MAFSISGLGSGIDWQSILDKYREAETQRISIFSTHKTAAEKKLSAWTTFSGIVSALQTASADLKSASGFDAFTTSLSSSSTTVQAESLLSASASSSANKGTYQVVVTNKAQVEKLASGSFSSQTAAMNVSGTILINGEAVTIEATDTLQSLSTKINALNTGTTPSNVTASVLQESTSSFRLVLTGENEGAAGISLQNGSSGDTLVSLGFNGSGTVIKNSVTGGAQSDAFSSSSTAVETLLGIAGQALSGNVVINGASVTIDLSDTLDTIKTNMLAAGISASIATETSGSTTSYRLQVEGMSTWTDDSNVLQALGLVQGGRDDVTGVKASVANTTDGSTAITSATNIVDIYGYLNYTAGDKVTISGAAHDGTAVAATDFALDGTKTVGDLLTQIQGLFGDVTASVTLDGKIQVVDNATGTSQLSVTLQTSIAGPGSLDFGSFGTAGSIRKYVVQQGEDAVFTVDGMSMTSSSNTVTTAIPGVTLNLLGEDSGTTVTVSVDRDAEEIEEKVNAMLTAYNDVISYINGQMTYNSDSKQTGGPLFGDNTLKSIKLNLQNLILRQVGTSDVSYMAAAGITIGDDNKLTLDTSTFESVLATNFDDVVNLFSDSGTSADSNFQYAFSGRLTLSGSYSISISQLSPLAGTIDTYDGTANGNILSLYNSSSNANGLGISFAGTTAPASATFTFTRGIASLLEGATYSASDAFTGDLTIQKNAVQDSIDRLSEKISNSNDQIDAKIAQLQVQFEAMDSAVTEMQAMQSYLSQQFSSS